MFFKDYKHIELLEEDITIGENRKETFETVQTVKGDRVVVATTKITGVKNWKPSNPFRLRVTATVRKSGTRKIKKKTFIYEKKYMVDALKDAEKQHDALIDDIKSTIGSPALPTPTDKDVMFTFKEAFKRSIASRKLQSKGFRTADQAQGFYNNYLKPLGELRLDDISTDTLKDIQENMRHKDGSPMANRTKMSVMQQVNPVYTWFNEYSNLYVKTPAKLERDTVSGLENEREVDVEDISPLFSAMYTYKIERFRNIFIWLLHGRRVNEVLTLDWKNINLVKGTYTITTEKNKAKSKMTYPLTPYQLATLPKPKKSGVVFPAETGEQMAASTLRTHWMKVRKAVGEWTLNDEQVDHTALHIHDIRHLLGSSMLNDYNINESVISVVLGHKRSSITARYAKVDRTKVSEAILKVLDGVLK